MARVEHDDVFARPAAHEGPTCPTEGASPEGQKTFPDRFGGRSGLGVAPAHDPRHANAESGCERPVRDRLCPSRPPRSPFLVGHHRDLSRSDGRALHLATSSQPCRQAIRRHTMGSSVCSPPLPPPTCSPGTTNHRLATTRSQQSRHEAGRRRDSAPMPEKRHPRGDGRGSGCRLFGTRRRGTRLTSR